MPAVRLVLFQSNSQWFSSFTNVCKVAVRARNLVHTYNVSCTWFLILSEKYESTICFIIRKDFHNCIMIINNHFKSLRKLYGLVIIHWDWKMDSCALLIWQYQHQTCTLENYILTSTKVPTSFSVNLGYSIMYVYTDITIVHWQRNSLQFYYRFSLAIKFIANKTAHLLVRRFVKR